MAIPGSVNPMMLGGGAPAVYQINQSLRFNSADSYTFRRTPGSDSTSQKKFTVSVWSKRGVIASGTSNNSGRQSIAYTGLSNGSGNLFSLEWVDDEVGCLFNGAGTIWPQTVAKFRDPSAWYHIVVAVDTDQATAADRCKIYVNGVQQTLTGTLPTSGFLVTNGTTSVHSVGELGSLRSNQYLAEMYYINDQQLAPTDFAETNNDGVWIPKAYAGTFTGTNSYYLKFDSAATNGIGHDDSGNSNTFTTTNFTTSGTGTDVMSDTPTTNWCTLNPLSYGPSNADMYEGNLRFDQPTSSTGNAKGTIAVSSGKWYWEVTPQTTSTANVAGGILGAAETSTSSQPGNYATGYSYYSTGETRHNGVDATYGASYGAGDVIGTALDLDAGTLVFYKNGVSQGTAYSSVSGTFVPAIGDTSTGSSSALVCNFGQRAFAYTPPTNFLPLNTSNLPAPTIKDGSDYFNTVLWTGDGNQTRSLTVADNSGNTWQPDFTWMKSRSVNQEHQLYDAVRGAGAGKMLCSNQAAQEGQDGSGNSDSQYGYISSFDTGGFSLNDGTVATTGGWVNYLNRTYVAWNWLANGSGSSNTDGTITSTVSANPTAGFSIVSYTGTGATASVGHGLNALPQMIVVKRRDSTGNWAVYHRTQGANSYLYLNSTAAVASVSNYWQYTPSPGNPTSSWFGVIGGYDVNASSANYIAYCFAEVEGYSKFGSYTGNGQSENLAPFINCGFKPAFLLIKSISSVANWLMVDNTRNDYNVVNNQLFANLGNSEFANYKFGDLVSNGFKVRDNSSGLQGNYNTNGATYVFAAFAENPFGGSGVSPATAR